MNELEIKIEEAKNRIINQTINEIDSFESDTINLSPTKTFSQYQKVNEIKTHQSKGFIITLPDGTTDDRMFPDIVSPLVDTGVKNIDINTKDFEPRSLTGDYQAQTLLLIPELKLFQKITNEAERINNICEKFIDEGNVVTRKVKEGIYKLVQLANLYVIDQAAESLEDTTVIEKDMINQTGLRKMKDWDQAEIKKMIETYKGDKLGKIPYYNIFYRYGEIALSDFKEIKGEPVLEEDNDKYIQTFIVFGKAKLDDKHDEQPQNTGSKGFLLFIDELKPEEIQIDRDYKISRYKPYAEAHFGAFKGRWLREGYREVCYVYQNRATELYNQLRLAMKLSTKLLLWSPDEEIAGKNILSAIQDGQIIKAEALYVLNNAEKNLSVYAEEWNKNIQLAERACQAFEIATGESSPSSTSATAINVQNINVNKFYDFKKQKLGIMFKEIYNRWVAVELTKYLTPEHVLEITGDTSYVDIIYDALVNAWYVNNLYQIPAHGPEEADTIKQLKKEELLKNHKLFLKVEKDFYKDAPIIIDFNITNEGVNKQNKVSNGLSLLPYLSNPSYMQDPTSRDILIQIASEVGYRVKNNSPKADAPQQEAMPEKPVQAPAGTPAEITSRTI